MIWYPYEQMKTMKDPYKILDAEGVHLYTKDQKLIDSISSWWCMIHGYKHPDDFICDYGGQRCGEHCCCRYSCDAGGILWKTADEIRKRISEENAYEESLDVQTGETEMEQRKP